jgi:hypothetical protein
VRAGYVGVSGGLGSNTYDVLDTAPSAETEIDTGANSTINVLGTSGSLDIFGYGSGNNVWIGNYSTAGVQAIKGSVYVSNGGGLATLWVDDGGDPYNHDYVTHSVDTPDIEEGVALYRFF